MLEKYFNVMVNDPFTRGSKCMKKFIKICKYGDKFRRANSAGKHTVNTTPETRPQSLKKVNKSIIINVNAWKK